MKTRKLFTLFAMLIALLALSAYAVATPLSAAPAQTPPAQDEPAAEEGPIAIVGEANSDSFIVNPDIFPNPSVVLLDATNYIQGQPDILLDDTAQIMGTFTPSMFPLPGKFRIPLPIQPNGASIDLDNDGEEDAGIQVFTLAVSSNIIGNSFLQQLEQAGGLGSFLADSQTGEITEGTFLIYAPDENQGFPMAIGEDGKWFTDDDPSAPLPKGYTVATLSADGVVTLDRSAEAVINTIEPAEQASPDFSYQGILESFNSLIDILKERYAYTDLRKLDWEAIRAEYLPRVEEADANQDSAAYFLVLDEIAQSIQDGHVQALFGSNQEARLARLKKFYEPIQGNVGARVIALTDPEAPTEPPGDTIVVLTVGGNSPAQEAGWVPGTEIVSINGEPPAERYKSIPVLDATGTEESRRLKQTELMLQFPMSETVTIEYVLPDSSDVLSATMVTGKYDVGAETPSLAINTPITYEQIGQYAVLRWSDFMRYLLAKIAVEEEALAMVAGNPTAGVILDMRGNGGGWIELYETMASYFYTADDPMPTHVFDWYNYDEKAGEFVKSRATDLEVSAPRPELAFTGPVIILVDEGCASSCEYLSQHMQVTNRATVMGQHGTDGAGGSIERVKLPDGLSFQFTKGRSTFAGTDEYNLEAKGVSLDIRIPVTLESELAKINGEDPVMDAAMAQLDEMTGANTANGSEEDRPPAEAAIGSWLWAGIVTPADGPVKIADPENYVLTFNEDGTVNVKADCNNAQGTYAIEDDSLSIELGPMTMAMCEEESRSDDFVGYLSAAVKITTEDGLLGIELADNGGTLIFSPAGEGS